MHDLTKRIKAQFHYELVPSLRKVARHHSVSKSSVSRWVKTPLEKVYVKETRKRRKLLDETCMNIVVQWLEHNPYTTMRQLQRIIKARCSIDASLTCIRKAILEKRMSYKKSHRVFDTHQVDKKHAFFEARINWETVISIDESGFTVDDRKSYGWSRKGKRVPKRRPTSRKRINVLAAVDSTGLVAYERRFGTYKSEDFADFVRGLPQGRQVLLDNVSFHKSLVVRQAAKERGIHLIFIPPYSPWFNPIEIVFSKTKQMYRARNDATDVDVASRLVDECFSNLGSFERIFQHVDKTLAYAISEFTAHARS